MMTSQRFFIEPEKIQGNEAVLDGADAHHLKNVLRLKTGDFIQLLNGSGTIFTAKIKKLGKKIDLEIENRQDYSPVRPSIHLAQGLLKGKKMDFLIQKATELGIDGFHPFTSLQGTADVPSENKTRRWRKIMIEACKQCGRADFMTIAPPISFPDVLSTGDNFEEKIILWENEPDQSLQGLGDLAAVDSILVVIGPEGGFSYEEIDQAQRKGFRSVKMGGITLRAESASFSVMAILQFLTGKLG